MSESIPSSSAPALVSEIASVGMASSSASTANPPDSHSEQTTPSFRLYNPPRTGTNTPSELPDSFFAPSAADLKAAQASLSARVNSLNNTPLRTQAMRDAEHTLRLARYPQTTIRIKFSDQTQLEKVFPSTDKIRAVYAFVRGSLREDVKPIKFVLFQTPPRRELKVSDPKVKNLNLFELELAPASVLHLKFEDEGLNHVTVPAPLDPQVLAHAEELQIPSSSEEATGTSPSKSKGSSSTSRSLGSSGGPTKVPKWLKLSKK